MWKDRDPSLTEFMDDPDCDRELLFRTYHQFARLNRLLSGWPALYRGSIRPRLDDPERNWSLLDLGGGGGDVARMLVERAARDGFRLEATVADPDPRAEEFFHRQDTLDGLAFVRSHSSDLLARGERYDFVISNHLLHHLHETDLRHLFSDAAQLAGRLVLFNDLQRSFPAALGFGLIAPLLFPRSFIRPDGLRSLRRSFTASELSALAPPGWEVRRMMPNRLLLLLEVDGD